MACFSLRLIADVSAHLLLSLLTCDLRVCRHLERDDPVIILFVIRPGVIGGLISKTKQRPSKREEKREVAEPTTNKDGRID